MIEILHDLKDPKLWELGYIPYYGSCRVYIINRMNTATDTLLVMSGEIPNTSTPMLSVHLKLTA